MGNTHHHEDNSHLVKQAEERMQREAHEHARRMKELENADKDKKRKEKKAQIAHINQILTELESDVKKDQCTLTTAKEDEALYRGNKEQLQEWINNFNAYKNQTLEAFKIQQNLDKAEQDYKRDFNEISNAIEASGVDEQNVGKFLKLTLSLIGATMNTSAETNKLDIALATFGKILNDECQDKLTVDDYFHANKLEKFIGILAIEGYTVLDHLKCDDKDAFEQDILELCEKGVKELEHNTEEKKEPAKEGDELCIYLLKKWRLFDYWGKLKEDGWDDAEDWLELTDEDLIDVIDKRGKRKQFMNKCKKWKQGGGALKQQERKILERICLKPETWSGAQIEKVNITKHGLLELSPILALFFGRMNDAVLQVGDLLAYKKQLSDMQLNATNMRKENLNKLKAIKMRRTDNDQRREWVQNTDCQIYSDSVAQWYSGKIIEIKRDSEGEWLNVQYMANNETRHKQVQRYSDVIRPIKLETDEKEIEMEMESIKDTQQQNEIEIQKQCRSLITASIVGISVTDTMIQEFNKNTLTERGLTLAVGVESACMRIIHGQGQIRQSVFLAQEILGYKPANMSSDKTRKLWKAVDDGIVQIFKSALEMVKVSHQYFAFFLRFKSAFQFFVTCYENGKDTNLMVSLERLRKDVRDFNGFTANFTKKIEELSSTSMDCIAKCVESQIGATNWENSRSSLELTEKRYLSLKKQYDEKGVDLDIEFDKKKQREIDFEHKEVGATYQVNMLTKRIQQNNDYLQQCRGALAQLNAVVI